MKDNIPVTDNSMVDLLEFSLTLYGLTELPGDRHNLKILEMFHAIGHDWVLDDETAWCGADASYCALQAGYKGSKLLNARSWLSVGQPVDEPILGCIVVLWREDRESWKGHVGTFINKTDTYIYILGGNQGNQHKISKYPLSRVLGYRILEKL